MTPAGTSNELDVQNGWEENTHNTHMGNIINYEIPFERCSDFGRRRRWKADDYDNNGKNYTDIIYIDVLTGSIFGNSKRRTKIYANIYIQPCVSCYLVF